MTMIKVVRLLSILIALAPMLAGCFADKQSVKSIEYPPTENVQPVFQKNLIPESCRVFAHIFATMPTGYNGQQFVNVVSGEARSKGADMILIGQSRQCTTETELDFTYYGPEREYKIDDWPGWSYGFEEWRKQGEWECIGYEEWGNSDVRYDYPILMQIALVRCQ